MKILIDFDDVLFNTKKFKEDYKKVFLNNWVDDKLFNETYYSKYVSEKRKSKLYLMEKHLKRLGKCGINIYQLRKNINKLVKNSKNYVFDDTNYFLKKFDKSQIYLLSFGKDKFKDDKIRYSDIKKNIKKIILTNKLKAETVKKLKIDKSDAPIIFLDDRVEQITSIKNHNPDIITILIKRKEGRYDDEKNEFCDYVAKNLVEAAKIIEQQILTNNQFKLINGYKGF